MTKKRLIKAKVITLILTVTIAIGTLPFFIHNKTVNAAVLSTNALVSEANTRNAGYSSGKAFRDAILATCKKLDGVKYQWGGGGWDGIDCAGSVSLAYSVALKTAKITGTSGSYGKKTLSYTGGGTPDKYGFERPGFAGIKSSFTNGILKTRGIKPTENHFSSFETNGTKGIQSDEWINIINKYGFLPGDMIMWWNDNNDKNNAQHITIYAGIEDGVPMHWTASSTAGYFVKKSLASSSSEAGKGSFTGFMGLKATALTDNAQVGFYLDKRDVSGINYLGAIFSIYKDSELTNLAGELRDDDSDGIYTDYYALNGSSFSKQKFILTEKSDQKGTYGNTLYIKETTAPSGIITDSGSKINLKNQDGKLPDIYTFVDANTYVIEISLSETDASKGKLEYSISTLEGKELYKTTKNDYFYLSGSDVIRITNMVTTDETAGRSKGAGLFCEAASVSLEKKTSTGFDTASVVFTVCEGSAVVASYKYTDSKWYWFDSYGNKLTGITSFPIKTGTDYVITEEYAKEEPFKCIDGTELPYVYKNSSGWSKVSDTCYQYVFTTDKSDVTKTYSFSCENNIDKGRFELSKSVSDKGDSKADCVFELWSKDLKIKLAEGVSTEDGSVLWKTGSRSGVTSFDLPSGDYRLAEVVPVKTYSGTSAAYTYKIPEGFKDGKDGKWYKDITIGTDKLSESVTNDRTEGFIKLVKKSEDGINGNVEFSIYYGGKDKEPVWQKSPLTSGKTDSLGYLFFNNLPTGWYRIDEKAAPTYKVVWDDGSEGKSRIVRINEADDNKTLEFKVTNKLDLNPLIHTELTGIDGAHDLNCGSAIELTDKVHIENLVTGYEYTLSGSLVDKSSGETLKDRQGKEYIAEVTFKADAKLGEVSIDEKGREVITGDILVKFIVDSSYLSEQAHEAGNNSFAIVCFESLLFRNVTIAEHKNIDDLDQTVFVEPKLSTKASDRNTGTGVLTFDEVVSINDKVSFEGLNPQDAYIVKGTLIDKTTGEKYIDSDGQVYEVSVEFSPEAPDGFVNVIFDDVKVPLDEVELVVFESLFIKGGTKPIASHRDLNDKNQTLTRPSCNTYATTVKGDKTILGNSTVTIVDHISYDNLEVGRTYYAKASLRLTDGTEITNKGSEVVSLQQFVPDSPSGQVDVTIKFKSNGLESGDTVVVFENIYDKSTDEEISMGIRDDDIWILSHEDLNNKDQSLDVTNVPVSGEILSPYTISGIVVFLISFGAATYVLYGEIKSRRIKRDRRC